MGKLVAFELFGVLCEYDEDDPFGELGEWEAAESDLDKYNAMKAREAFDLSCALVRETSRQEYLTECRNMFKRARSRANATKQARARAEYVAFLRDWW